MVHSLDIWEIAVSAALIVLLIVAAAAIAKIVQDRVDRE
jgi:hypothetical protein